MRSLLLAPLLLFATPANAITWEEFWDPFTGHRHTHQRVHVIHEHHHSRPTIYHWHKHCHYKEHRDIVKCHTHQHREGGHHGHVRIYDDHIHH